MNRTINNHEGKEAKDERATGKGRGRKRRKRGKGKRKGTKGRSARPGKKGAGKALPHLGLGRPKRSEGCRLSR
jgi:hypothetical protein